MRSLPPFYVSGGIEWSRRAWAFLTADEWAIGTTKLTSRGSVTTENEAHVTWQLMRSIVEQVGQKRVATVASSDFLGGNAYFATPPKTGTIAPRQPVGRGRGWRAGNGRGALSASWFLPAIECC